MADNLVIVESPTKAKTIGRFLGKNYKVEASVGHVRDLPKSTLGIDIENGFEPKYMTIRGKADVVNTLKKEAKAAKKVYLATDPDREGEAISWHLAYLLGIDPKSVCRVTFPEITEKTVKAAIKNPQAINMDVVDAQQARRVLDRIVGYKISPLLWKNVRKGLSAGRVQSVATRIICDREEEIQAFEPKEYWNLTVKLSKLKGKGSFTAKFYGTADGKKMEISNETQANQVLGSVQNADFIVKEVKTSQKAKQPLPPFTTSTLQQEASRKLGFQTKKTMQIAQQLYEGVEIKGKATGLVTYIRTDSVRLSEEATAEIRSWIGEKYGEAFLPANIRKFANKNAAQDAHEAIRPAYPTMLPEEIKSYLSNDQYKLYKLIWERFAASQMSNAVLDVMTVDVTADVYSFRASGSKVNFPGYMKVYMEGKDEKDEKDEEENTNIPALEAGEELKAEDLNSKQMFTQPPARYTEATLVKALEEKGIGRPSTYAPTISTILSRGYIEREKKVLYPTELGKVVNELMKKHFDEIVDIKFTANMESDLDHVEEGTEAWKEVISRFYGRFATTLEKAEESIGKVVIQDEVSDVVCEKCGRQMVIKNGSYGKFLACPGFPECRNTKNIVEEAGVECPVCHKPLIVRKTKKMKPYLACSGYPDCKFVSWDMPIKDSKCETCGSFMVRHFFKGGKSYPRCGNPGCVTNQQNTEAGEETK